jgi:hypothetical protein
MAIPVMLVTLDTSSRGTGNRAGRATVASTASTTPQTWPARTALQENTVIIAVQERARTVLRLRLTAQRVRRPRVNAWGVMWGTFSPQPRLTRLALIQPIAGTVGCLPACQH